MRIVLWIVFALAFLVLNICLLVPTVSYNMSWSEAAIGIVPGALVALVCFALLVAGVGAKRRPRFRAPSLWAAALLWSLLVGGIVVYSTINNYQYNRSRVVESTMRGISRGDLSESFYYADRARSDRIGTVFGLATLGFAVVSLVGLIVSLIISFALRKKPQDNVSAP